MRVASLPWLLSVALLACSAAPGEPAHPVQPRGYQVVHGWPMIPDDITVGWVISGVALDSRGDVYVLHRAGREWPTSDQLDLAPIADACVLVFDASTGALRRRFGAGMFAMPHGITIDRNDHVWITDVALQQVFELTADGRVIRTLGERGVAGADHAHFDRPTKVAVAEDGAFFVSDGYRNSRVIAFAGDGRFVREWGTKGSASGQFDTPHGITRDTHGRIYVADRGNARVQIFDGEGHLLGVWAGPRYGRPFDVAVMPDGAIAIADGGDMTEHARERASVVIVAPDGSVRERFGRFGPYDGQFFRAHDLAVGADGAIYVGDANGRIQKFTR